MRRLGWAAAAVLAGALALGGCGKGGDEAAGGGSAGEAAAAGGGGGGAVSAAAKAEADEIWTGRCVTCHGPQGTGDGPGSKGLVPQPRNFQDPAWQKSVTDEHIEKIIMGGGAAVGKSPTMPSNPDLMAKSEVVRALRMHVRELAAGK